MKRFWSVIAAGALISSVFTVGTAQAATEVPATVNIEDPKGDANFLNSGQAAPLGQDNVTPADASSLADILKVWFTNDAETITAHIQTEAALPGGNGVAFNVFASPGEGPEGSSTVGCLRFFTVQPGSNPGGGTYQGSGYVKLHDRCNTGGSVFDAPDAEFASEKLDDGTGLVSITAKRADSPLFADGSVLTTPSASSSSPAVGHQDVGFLTPSVDNTKPGTDYTISSGGEPAGDPVAEEPKEENPEPKGCKKGKGKKKGCGKGSQGPKTPPPAGNSCAAFTPGEKGAAAETTVVTDAATEEAPIVIDVPMARAMGKVSSVDNTAHVLRNIQLDTDAAEAGLFAKLESPVTDDPDLYVYWPSGKEAAVAGGFNQALFAGPIPSQINSVINLNGTGSGGHSGFGFEQIDGLRTADCAGWTLDLVNWLGQGGTYKLKLWVGEIQNDPAPEN